jgi:hypothetical protein
VLSFRRAKPRAFGFDGSGRYNSTRDIWLECALSIFWGTEEIGKFEEKNICKARKLKLKKK